MRFKRGNMPGAFVLTARRDCKKYVMSEATLQKVIDRAGEKQIDFAFEVAWEELSEAEKGMAEEIYSKYCT